MSHNNNVLSYTSCSMLQCNQIHVSNKSNGLKEQQQTHIWCSTFAFVNFNSGTFSNWKPVQKHLCWFRRLFVF